jgi:hypothetical protein
MGFWIATLAVAVVLFALAWWTSGRARPRGRGPESSMTARQLEGSVMNIHQQRHGQGPVS